MKKVYNIPVNWSFNINMDVKKVCLCFLLMNCPIIAFGQFINTLIDDGEAEGARDVVVLSDTIYLNCFKTYLNKSSKINIKYSTEDGNFLVDEYDVSPGSIYYTGIGSGMNCDSANDRVYYTGSKKGVGFEDKAYILVTELSGDSLKEISFQDSTLFQTSMLLSDNEHLICAGSTNNHNSNTTDINMWIVKCDTAGNIIWQNNFGGNGDETTYAVDQTHDGGFVLSGFTNSYGAGSYDIYVVKVDSQGNFEWQKTLGDINSDFGYVKALESGDLIVYGGSNNSLNDRLDGIIYKLDSLGNEKWENRLYYNLNKDDWFESMVVVNDGYVFCGSSIDEVDNNPLGWILKTDFNGNELWRRRYRKRDNDNYFKDITELPNGDLVLCGFVFPENGSQTQDAWLVRTNCFGFDTFPLAQANIVSNSNVDMTVELDNNSKYWGNCIINWGDGNSNYLYEDYDTIVTHQYESVNTWNIEVIALACGDSDTAHIQISTDVTGVGLDENELEPSFSMYPNPASDEVEIELKSTSYSGTIYVSIYNLMGQEMRTFEAQEANGAERFSTRDFNNGVYIVTIRDDKGVQHTGKLVVQH